MEEKLKRKKEEDEQMWREYLEQRKKQRAKEEEELRKLKERQAKRKLLRAQQEAKMLDMKRKQEEQRQKEMEDKKAKEAEAKRKRLEEAERKRQAMQEAMKKEQTVGKPNFVIAKKEGGEDGGPGAALGSSGFDKSEMGKTKEQLEEDKKMCMQFRIKPLEIEGLKMDELKTQCKELWEHIIQLESDKYDLEDRMKRQDYDVSTTCGEITHCLQYLFSLVG
ncbi:TNNT2 [Cordylochernes scorpioides]|uniref:TNNT2 n=1 Tax=Cordylochernes scorpioides TaxID=51811 RepID=A0ABY6LA05_9ARAC|nr:TNNT2 [Cordylochernes scorpioides]